MIRLLFLGALGYVGYRVYRELERPKPDPILLPSPEALERAAADAVTL